MKVSKFELTQRMFHAMPTVTEINTIVKSKDFKQTNDIWNGKDKSKNENLTPLNAPQHVGMCMKLIEEAQPKTLEEWFLWYSKWYLNHNSKEIYPLELVAKQFSQRTNLDLKIALQYAYIRVVYQTYNGYANELNAIENIKKYLHQQNPNKRYTVIKADDHFDRELGVDVRVFEDKKEVAGIQLKPNSYFKINHYTMSWQDKENRKKQAKYVKQIKAPVLYWTYSDLEKGYAPKMSIDVNQRIHDI